MSSEISVLLVDDDSAFTDLVVSALERAKEGFRVETATSAVEGLERIDDGEPDCVISDYDMPGMDGIEFLHAVREDHPDLPFILFTGKGSETVASEAIAADVTDYLQKGSDSERYELLANRIRNAVQARREAKRAARQEQLMRLTEFAGETGGFELNVENGQILFTDGARRILNLPDDPELTFDAGIENFHPDDRKRMLRSIDRAFRTGQQIDGEFRYQPSYAEERLLYITWTPGTASGETGILRGAIKDITDRKERRQELRQTKNKYQTLMENFPEGAVFVYDTDLRVVCAGGAELADIGFSSEAIVGEKPSDRYPPEIAEHLVRHLEDALDGVKASFEQEYDGQRYRVQTAPVRAGDGDITHVMAVSQNLSALIERHPDR